MYTIMRLPVVAGDPVVGLEEEWVGLREGVGESVTAKRRMITLHTYKEGREEGQKKRSGRVHTCIS